MTATLSFPAPTERAAQTSLPAERATPWLNALTVDVEDYYHVSGFDHCVDRGDWDRLPARVGASTDRLLDCLAAANVRGTFFVLGWVAARQPSLVRAIRSAGH